MNTTTRTPLWRSVTATILLAPLAAGCGSDDSGSSGESQATAPQESQPDAAQDQAGQPESPSDEPAPQDDTAEDDTPADEAPATTDAAPSDDGTTTGEAPAPTVPARIVRIGVAFPDLAAFAVLNPEFGIGDPEAQALAVVDQWAREGLLPEGMGVDSALRGSTPANRWP